MAMSAKERQAARRERIQFNAGKGLSVIQTFDEKMTLEKLTKHYGITKAAMIGRLIFEEDERIIRSLLDDKAGLDHYMGRDTSQEDPQAFPTGTDHA